MAQAPARLLERLWVQVMARRPPIRWSAVIQGSTIAACIGIMPWVVRRPAVMGRPQIRLHPAIKRLPLLRRDRMALRPPMALHPPTGADRDC